MLEESTYTLAHIERVSLTKQEYNITAAWAVDREFVYIVGPAGRVGSGSRVGSGKAF